MARVASGSGQAELAIYSCGRDHSPGPTSQFVINVAGMRDPLSNRGFKHSAHDGTDPAVVKFVEEDPRMDAIRTQVLLLAHMNLRLGAQKKWLSFAIKDHHGKWIAPAVAESLANSLDRMGYSVTVAHFDLGKIGGPK